MSNIDIFMNNLYDKLDSGVYMIDNVYYLDFSYEQQFEKSDIGRFIDDHKCYDPLYPTFFADFNNSHNDYILGYITNHTCSVNLNNKWDIKFRIIYKKLK